MSYRTWWTRTWAAVITAGVCWAGVVLPLSLAVFTLCAGGVAVALAGAALQHDDVGEVRAGARGAGRRRLAWGGTSCLAVAGLWQPAPALVGLLMLAAVVSSPAVVARVLGRWGTPERDESPAPAPAPALRPDPATGPVPAPGPDPAPGGLRPVEALATMTDAALFRLWTDSYWALRRASSGRDRGMLIELRGRVLDEMDRRDPRAMTTWLIAGAWPHQSPRAFFRDES